MSWFTKKKQCMHCEDKMTSRRFEDQPTCASCKMKVLMDRESTRTCPVDGATLLKEHKYEIIIDRCPTCKGVWLDADEIDAIKQAGQSEGIALGMVI